MLEASTRKTYLTSSGLRAKMGGIGKNTVYRAYEGEDAWLPKPVKLGGMLYWDEAAVDAAIAQRAELQAREQHAASGAA